MCYLCTGARDFFLNTAHLPCLKSFLLRLPPTPTSYILMTLLAIVPLTCTCFECQIFYLYIVISAIQISLGTHNKMSLITETRKVRKCYRYCGMKSSLEKDHSFTNITSFTNMNETTIRKTLCMPKTYFYINLNSSLSYLF